LLFDFNIIGPPLKPNVEELVDLKSSEEIGIGNIFPSDLY